MWTYIINISRDDENFEWKRKLIDFKSYGLINLQPFGDVSNAGVWRRPVGLQTRAPEIQIRRRSQLRKAYRAFSSIFGIETISVMGARQGAAWRLDRCFTALVEDDLVTSKALPSY